MWKKLVVVIKERHPFGGHHFDPVVAVPPRSRAMFVDGDGNCVGFPSLIQHARDGSRKQHLRS